LKIGALVINVAVMAYLLWAHRLFGFRGGGRVDRIRHEHDTGWGALERATPVSSQLPKPPQMP
jgi:catalase (peroxidase I)